MGLKRYWNTWRVGLKNNWVRAAVYRTNFVTAFIVDLVWISVEFALFGVIYANTSQIAGWTQPQVFFFLGVFFVGDALFTVFFQTNFWRFSDLVNKGEFDILLTKPVHPLFLALTRWVNLTAVLNILLGIGIIARYAEPAGFRGGVSGVLLLVFWILLGLSINVLVRFLFSVAIFWTDRGFALSRLYYQFYQVATKPDVIYPSAVRYLILTALPFAFVGSVPARAVLFGLQLKEYFLIAVSILGFFLLNRALWRAGLRRYQSASS